MPHAIRLQANGGPEVLSYQEVTVGEPGSGEARVRHTAIGLNYIDTYHRTGQYPQPLPAGRPRGAGLGKRGSRVDWVKTAIAGYSGGRRAASTHA